MTRRDTFHSYPSFSPSQVSLGPAPTTHLSYLGHSRTCVFPVESASLQTRSHTQRKPGPHICSGAARKTPQRCTASRNDHLGCSHKPMSMLPLYENTVPIKTGRTVQSFSCGGKGVVWAGSRHCGSSEDSGTCLPGLNSSPLGSGSMPGSVCALRLRSIRAEPAPGASQSPFRVS